MEVDFDKQQNRVRCLSHAVNRAAQVVIAELGAEAPEDDILLEDAPTNPVSSVRQIARSIRASPQRRDAWDGAIETYNKDVKRQNLGAVAGSPTKELMPPLQLLVDVRTRWDSTFIMIKRFIQMEVVRVALPPLLTCNTEAVLQIYKVFVTLNPDIAMTLPVLTNADMKRLEDVVLILMVQKKLYTTL